jgi:predicted phosphate transport protein (TIGR00153 family)
MPREGKFFEYFNDHAEQMLRAAGELKLLMQDLSRVELRTRNIKDMEHAADRITHDTMHLLHRTFITPIDRNDIYQLIHKMDDVLDLIEDVAQCILLYDIRQVPKEAQQLADLCVSCAGHIKAAVGMLANMRNSEQILQHCVEVDRLESEADILMRGVVVRLFREEPDTRELIRMKAIYEILETVTDRCEDVANIIEGIVLENA